MWHFKHKRIRHIKYFHCIIRVATFVYFYQVYYWKNLPLLLFSSRNVYLLLLVNEIFTLDNLSIIFFEKKAKVKNEDDTQCKKSVNICSRVRFILIFVSGKAIQIFNLTVLFLHLHNHDFSSEYDLYTIIKFAYKVKRNYQA